MEDQKPGGEKEDRDDVGLLIGRKGGWLDDDVGDDCYVVCDRWVEHCRLVGWWENKLGGILGGREWWDISRATGCVSECESLVGAMFCSETLFLTALVDSD